jgi:tRNA A37 threonylcarbamoyladenosine dehydratase
MNNNMVKQRFGGTERLYGTAGLAEFSRAHVCVVGIGGVGTWVAEGLVRSGIGAITIIDLDDICITNTNRQIHALQNTIGTAKVDAMAERLKLINPHCTINTIEDFVLPENVATYITTTYSYVVDATDSITAKCAIIAHCKRNKIPIITIGGAGGQVDPTQISVSDLTKTIQDPLATKLRNELRRKHHFPKNTKRKFGVDCVFSSEQLRYPQGDGSVSHRKIRHNSGVKLDCETGFGASVAVTATFGFVAVSKVLDKILTKNNVV